MDDHGGIVWTSEKELGNWQVMGDSRRGDRRRTRGRSDGIGIAFENSGIFIIIGS